MKNYEREDVLHFLLKSLVKQIDINDDNCFLLEVRDKYGTTSQDNIARWLCSDYVKPEHKWTKWELETMSHISPFYEALSKKEEVIRWLKAELYPPESIFDLKDKSFENKNTITNNYSNMKGKKKKSIIKKYGKIKMCFFT